jgi:WD40 repeat protein
MLPPANRRLLVQAFVNRRSVSKIYDRANLPDDVLEILRLTGGGIRPFVIEFAPQRQISTGRSMGRGTFAISPDAARIVTADLNGPYKMWDSRTLEQVGALSDQHHGCDQICFSPDGSIAVAFGLMASFDVFDAKGWQFIRTIQQPEIEGRSSQAVNPRFTADGKHLTVGSPDLSLRTFDVRTWTQRAAPPPSTAGGVAEFDPIPATSRALALSTHGDLWLWDSDLGWPIATLDRGVRIGFLSVSPDRSEFAVATARLDISRNMKRGWTGWRIRVWNTATGRIVHELRPHEQNIDGDVTGLAWSPDGQYVLAGTMLYSNSSYYGIAIWNATTGRHQGEFKGVDGRMNGFAILPNEKQIVSGSNGPASGVLEAWGLAAALKDIREFDRSLATGK